MPTLLVVDDDPLIAAYFQSIMPNMAVASTPNGREAMAFLRRAQIQQSLPDVIVLDINMPEVDGYDTCVLIRVAFSRIPVVPFTGLDIDANPALSDYLAELGCQPALRKGTPPALVHTALQHALRALTAPPAVSPGILTQLHAKAYLQERRSGYRDRRPWVLLSVASLVERAGLAALFHGIADISVVQTTGELEMSLLTGAAQIVVGLVADAARLLEWGRSHAIPTLLIAPSVAAGASLRERCAASPMPVGIVVADDGMTQQRLATAIETLLGGTSYVDPQLAHDRIVVDHQAIFQHAFPALSPRLVEVVMLHMTGHPARAISERMHISSGTLTQYWKRIYEKLRADRREVEHRAHRALREHGIELGLRTPEE